jgi:membrane associated rhomboid family serine protease
LLPIKDDIPTRRFPIVTIALIAINVVMFFGFQHATLGTDGAKVDEQVTVKYAAIPYEITHPGDQCVDTPSGQVACGPPAALRANGLDSNLPPTLLTILTAMFMHGGLLHIGGNLLFLWIFGNNIEDSMNRGLFVLFYLLGGAVAMLAQTAISPDSTVPTLGASGAIAAVLGGYAVLYPRARVLTLVFIVFFVTILRLPALLVLGVWFLLQFLDLSANQPVDGGGGVAYLAHIGGFVFGLIAIKLFATRVHEDYERPHRLPVY